MCQQSILIILTHDKVFEKYSLNATVKMYPTKSAGGKKKTV